jgi:hypothetical protein
MLMVKEQEIDEMIKLKLETLSYDESVCRSIREQMEQEWEQRVSITELQRKNLEAELREQEQLKKGLVRRIALEDDFKTDFEEELRKVNQEIEVTKTELQHLKDLEEANTDKVTEFLNLSKNLHKQYEKLSDEKKRQLLNIVFKNITVIKGEWQVRGKTVKFSKPSIFVAYTEPSHQFFENWIN